MRNGWTEIRLRDICSLNYGKGLPERNRSGSGYPVVGASGTVGYHDSFIVDGPAIIVGRKGSAGAVVFIESDCWPIDTTYWVEVARDKADFSFVRYLLEHLDLPRLVTTTAIPGINRETVLDEVVRLPSIQQQRQIAHLLGAFDTAITRAREHHTTVRELAEPVRREMLNLEGQERPLRDLVVSDGLQIGPFGSQLHASDYRPDGTPVVMPRDMIDGRIETGLIARIGPDDARRLSRHRLEVGDILLPRRGDLTKRALVRQGEEGWLCGTGSIRIRVPREQSRLVFEALSLDETSAWLVSHAVGTTMLNLNTEIVGRIPLTIPGVVEATPFLASLEASESLERAANARIASLRAARDAMLTVLLSGAHEIPKSFERFIRGNEPAAGTKTAA